MPDLVGKNIAVATSEAEQLGFKVEAGKAEHDEKMAKGNVLRTDPAAGTEVERGQNPRWCLIASRARSAIAGAQRPWA